MKIKLEGEYWLDKYSRLSRVVVTHIGKELISVLHLSTGERENLSKEECKKYLKC